MQGLRLIRPHQIPSKLIYKKNVIFINLNANGFRAKVCNEVNFFEKPVNLVI